MATQTLPEDILLAKTHEYILVEDDRARVGISNFAAEQLGDVVFVELPEVGDTFEKGESFGTIESVKAASDLYMPVTGEIVAVNGNLEEETGCRERRSVPWWLDYRNRRCESRRSEGFDGPRSLWQVCRSQRVIDFNVR